MDEVFIIAEVSSEAGCSWENNEYTTYIQTINPILIDLVPYIKDVISDWVYNKKATLKNEVTYILLLEHKVIFDVGGAPVDDTMVIISQSERPFISLKRGE